MSSPSSSRAVSLCPSSRTTSELPPTTAGSPEASTAPSSPPAVIEDDEEKEEEEVETDVDEEEEAEEAPWYSRATSRMPIATGGFALRYDTETVVHKIDKGGEDQALRYVHTCFGKSVKLTRVLRVDWLSL